MLPDGSAFGVIPHDDLPLPLPFRSHDVASLPPMSPMSILSNEQARASALARSVRPTCAAVAGTSLSLTTTSIHNSFLGWGNRDNIAVVRVLHNGDETTLK